MREEDEDEDEPWSQFGGGEPVWNGHGWVWRMDDDERSGFVAKEPLEPRERGRVVDDFAARGGR
jgi:hypothetical protein